MSPPSREAARDAFIERYGLRGRSELLYFCDRAPGPGSSSRRPNRPDGWVAGEPSTIWTRLSVGCAPSKVKPKSYPTYQELTPDQRFTYLRWLAGKNLERPVPHAYGTLYYLGLERKIFGEQYERASKEVLRLRELFPENYLLQNCSEYMLFAAALYHDDYLSPARLLAQGVFDEQTPSFRQSLLYWLMDSEAEFRFPVNWLARWVMEALGESKAQDEEFKRQHYECFVQQVEGLLRARPLRERFAAACHAVEEVSYLNWSFANLSEYAPRPPGSLEFKAVFVSPAFLNDFKDAWKEARKRARLVLRTKASEREDREQDRLEEGLVLPPSYDLYERIDARLTIRLAVSLAEQGQTAEARPKLQGLLKQQGLNADDRDRAQKILSRLGA